MDGDIRKRGLRLHMHTKAYPDTLANNILLKMDLVKMSTIGDFRNDAASVTAVLPGIEKEIKLKCGRPRPMTVKSPYLSHPRKWYWRLADSEPRPRRDGPSFGVI